MTGLPLAGRLRAGVRVQGPAQGRQALDGLALDGPGGAAENLRGLLDVQVAVEPQDERGPLARRHRGERGAQIEQVVVVVVASGVGAGLGDLAVQADPAGPRRAALAEELVHEDGPGVGVDMVGGPGPGPVHVELGDRGLH
jgi:hypothetical protein